MYYKWITLQIGDVMKKILLLALCTFSLQAFAAEGGSEQFTKADRDFAQLCLGGKHRPTLKDVIAIHFNGNKKKFRKNVTDRTVRYLIVFLNEGDRTNAFHYHSEDGLYENSVIAELQIELGKRARKNQPKQSKNAVGPAQAEASGLDSTDEDTLLS